MRREIKQKEEEVKEEEVGENVVGADILKMFLVFLSEEFMGNQVL